MLVYVILDFRVGLQASAGAAERRRRRAWLRLRIVTVPGAQEEARRNSVESETNKDKSIVVVMLLLRVMTYVVFYKLFWN